MEETPIVQSEQRSTAAAPPVVSPRPKRSMASTLSFVVGLVGIAAIGASAWVYSETQRDIARISTDIAQIKLSLTLYGQQQAEQTTAAPTTSGDAAALTDLSNRLGILEENWRNNTAAAAVPATLPPITDDAAATPAADAAVPTDGDCLPTGTRFMVAAGDVYPVCGTQGKVEIGAVDNGFITLRDGTVIAQGGTIGLPNTRCMIGVVPSDGGSISGFAEIRVTC